MRGRVPRWLRVSLVILGVLIIVLGAALWVFTATPWGHETIRGKVLGALAGRVNGTVRLGRISGNLLEGITIHDFSIRDSAGRPFLAIERASVQYGFRALLKKRIHLNEMNVEGLLVVLDKRPGEKWNYQQIFRRTTPADTTKGPGFGSWMRFENLTLARGRIIIRSPWSPSDRLSPAGRDSAIAIALGGGSRLRVERVDGGFQKVSDFRDIDAQLPLVRLAEPGTGGHRIFEIATASALALPFNPPAVQINNVTGRFELNGDSLWFSPDTRIRLAASDIVGGGRYVFDNNDLRLRLRANPVATSDLRWIHPPLPADGRGTLDFALDWENAFERYVARGADIRLGGAELHGDLGLTFVRVDTIAGIDTLAIHDTRLRFTAIDTRLIEQIFPQLKFPRQAVFSGRAALEGGLHAMKMDGDVSFTTAGLPAGRVVAAGEVGRVEPSGVRAENLRVRLDPLPLGYVELTMGNTPLAGILRGSATLDGSTRTRFLARGDVSHEDGSERSRVVGDVALRLAGPLWMDVNARAAPIDLATVGRFVPALGLRGVVAGPLRVTGTMNDLALRADLDVTGGGFLSARGRVDLAGSAKSLELEATMRVFDASRLSTRAPATSLTATASARVAGFDAATMAGAIALDAGTSTFDSVGIDLARLRVTLGGGMARVDTLFLRGTAATVSAGGSFGLAPGREGTLRFTAAVDSLSAFERWIGRDSLVTPPRPGVVARAAALAREDSTRIARATEVERAVTGAPAPKLVVSAPPAISHDSIRGSLYTAGTISGGLSRFDVRGRLGAEGVVARGMAVGNGRAEYALTNVRTPAMAIVGAAQVDSVSVAGFWLDSADVRVAHQSDSGTLAVEIFQANDRSYAAAARYLLHPDHNELHLENLALRFDTTSWRATRASEIEWGPRGVRIDSLDLRTDPASLGGRVFVNGLLPTQGDADLEVAVARFEIGHLVGLLESDLKATGLLTMSGRMRGPLRAPTWRGAAGIESASYMGTAIPDLKATFDYADATLRTHVEAARAGGTPVVLADGIIPINLALQDVTGSRFPDRPLQVDLVADSLPLDVLPRLTDAIYDVRGRAVGSMKARGTLRHPLVTGAMVLDLGSFGVTALGVRVRDINGVIRMQGDTLVIDSIVGISGAGPIRLAGGLGISTLTRPSFDLLLAASNARVLDNDRGRLRADADLAIVGPYDGVVITGAAIIRNGVVYLPEPDDKQVISADDPALFNVIDTALVTDRELLPDANELLDNLQVNVTVGVQRDTWVRSREANVELTSDGDLSVRMNRRTNSLAVEGFLTTERGQYTFLGKRFEIRRGSATFVGTPELNPTLQVTGEYEVRLPAREQIIIRVLIGGTMRSPRLSLESDAQPPIPQSDLLSYLAFGRSSSSLLQFGGSGLSGSGSSGGGLVGTGAALAGKQLAAVALDAAVSELEGEATRSLGADVFNITPANLPAEFWRPQGFGDVLEGTEVELGKYTDSRTFVAVQARPTRALPGLRVERRIGGGYRVEASMEPRFLLRDPSFTFRVPVTTNVLGLFLIRERRF